MERKLSSKDTQLPRWVVVVAVLTVLAAALFLLLHGTGVAPTGHMGHPA